MTTLLITQDANIAPENFHSASSQAGMFVSQPTPDSNNTGNLKLMASGDIADEKYTGMATADGTTSTIYCTWLGIFGDGFFSASYITITTGACTGEERVIVSSDQSDNSVTVFPGFSAAITTGIGFYITNRVKWVDFVAKIVQSGDLGGATFKWSYTGGDVWLGRQNVDQADWPGQMAIADTDNSSLVHCREAKNGDLVKVFEKSNYLYCCISTDSGKMFDTPFVVSITEPELEPLGMTVLSSGRILVTTYRTLFYSDNDGEDWSKKTLPSNVRGGSIIEMPNYQLLMVEGYTTTGVQVHKSTDGGTTWGIAIDVDVSVDSAKQGNLLVTTTGDIVCAYSKYNGGSPDNSEIRTRRSTDLGETWDAEITAMLHIITDMSHPRLVNDINGDIYLAAIRGSTNIEFCKSVTYAEDWEAKKTLFTDADTKVSPDLCLVDGHIVLCVWNNNGAGDYSKQVRRGVWETYVNNVNACPCFYSPYKHKLCCSAYITWYGDSGVSDDQWTFGPDYAYAMDNIALEPLSKTWRSASDQIECDIIIYLGEHCASEFSGFSLFNCNFRDCWVYADDASDFVGCSVIEEISMDLGIGINITDVVNNMLECANFCAGYNDHELKGKSLRPTSGPATGKTWRIRDNIGDWIALETSEAHTIVIGNVCCVFTDKAAKHYPAGLGNWLRIKILPQETAEGYYEIGFINFGTSLVPQKSWLPGFKKKTLFDIKFMGPGKIPIQNRDSKKQWSLTFRPNNASTGEEIVHNLHALQGKCFTIVPDADLSIPNIDCELVKCVSDLEQTHLGCGYYNLKITLESVI